MAAALSQDTPRYAGFPSGILGAAICMDGLTWRSDHARTTAR